jgi:hypothetical protein
MKNLIVVLILSVLSLTTANAAEAKASQPKNNEDGLSWTPSYNLSVGGQTGPMTSSQAFVQFSAFLLRDSQLEYSNLLGVGVSLDTEGKTYATICPMTMPLGHVSVFQPVIGIPITGNSMKLGLAVGWYF